MKAVFVIISFTLLLFFLQASAEESQDASVIREVRAADAGKKDARAKRRKKKCKGKKCQKRTKERKKGKGKKEKCKKGKNCKQRNKGKGRKAKGRKENKGKRPRDRKGGKGKKGGKGSKGKGGKRRKGKGAKGGKRRKGKGGKGKKGKRPRYSIEFNRKSDRQTNETVPAKCTEKCSDSEYVSLFNKYKQNDNMLRQLQRLVRFYDLIRKKQASAASTFQPAFDAIKDATSDCTMCKDSNVSASALGNCTLLKNCSVSAPAICSTTKITYGKVGSKCPDKQGDDCPASNPNKDTQCGDGCPPDTGPPKCTDVCKTNPVNEPDLTEADKTFAENDCLPVLRNWTKQYRDCNAGDTFSCQQSGCNDNKGECNLLNCRCDTPKRTCDFEECVKETNVNGKEYESFVCNTCLKKLDANLEIPARCKTIAKYERAVFARKEECIRKDIKGSFGDCARSQKAIIPFITACSSCTATTTVAPSGRRLSALKNQNLMLNNKKQFW